MYCLFYACVRVCRVHRELKSLGEGQSDKLRKIELEDSLAVIDAASDLHIPNIKNHNLVRVKSLCRTLTREGHDIPPAHQVHLTLVVCLTYNQKGEVEAYMSCLNLNLSVAWSGDKASFGGCIAFSPECSDSDAVNAAVLVWPQAIFCNSFWKALEDALSRQKSTRFGFEMSSTTNNISAVGSNAHSGRLFGFLL